MVWYHHTGTSSQGKDILKAKRASLADETFEMLIHERQQTSRNNFFANFLKSLINALFRFFWC
jgi:hypothetical protein